MTIEIIQNDLIKAMKEKDTLRKEVLSSLLGAVKNAAIEKKCRDNITEDLIAEVALKEQKTMREMIETCPKDREDLMENYVAKSAILENYAPKLMTNSEEILAFISSLGIDLVKSNRGVIMAALRGKADMKLANTVVGGVLK